MNSTDFSFATDTATLVVFDTDCLKHRLDDEADWWCYPLDDQLTELANGNAAFIELGSDGAYSASVQLTALENAQFQFRLNSPSGRLFVGAGEEVTSDGLEPECIRGGAFISTAAQTSIVQVARGPDGKILVAILPSAGEAANMNLRQLVLE